MNTERLGPVAFLILEAAVYGDASYIADLVTHGQTAEADEYAQRPDVQARIRQWKENRP